MSFSLVRPGSTSKKLIFTVGLIIAFGIAGMVGLTTSRAFAGDCSGNSIIVCGTSSPSQFVDKVRANDDGHGHHDLQAIYAAYGLEPSSYDRFVKYSRQGTAYRDGRIVVDGQTVATNMRSIGRDSWLQGSGYFSQNIGGHTYYGNVNSKAFAAGVNSLAVTVLFNGQGVMQFAVINSCGNPGTGNKITPTYSCNLLQESQVSGKLNTYRFTTSASAGNNATISKLVYDFGDGSTATTTNPATPVEHTYTKAGNFTATVHVYVHLPGNQTVSVTSAKCAKQITVVAPYYSCIQLTPSVLDKSKFSYRFVVTAKAGNGATFTSTTYDLGDGHTQTVQANGDTTTLDYTYAQPGDYNIAATLHFDVNGQSVTAQYPCTASVSPTQPPTPTCKPGVPVGSPLCTPCQYNVSLPSNSPECVPPVLPNTGAGNTIAITAVVAVLGFLAYRQVVFRRHRAAFMAADRSISPKLDQSAPFSDAPDASPQGPVRSSFRRRRPF